ncbi:hypothetical protein QZH41_020578 [Actinostola sp. cb2023]|nr:hypothetical protein QZH41_020578 [Actinostola sp. cb2023]
MGSDRCPLFVSRTESFGIQSNAWYSQSLQERDINPDIWNRQDGSPSSFPKRTKGLHTTLDSSNSPDPLCLTLLLAWPCLPRQGDRLPVGTKCYLSG